MAQVIICLITLSNVNQFLNFFHCQNQEKNCNNIISKDPTTPQVCCYSTMGTVTEWDWDSVSLITAFGQWRRRLKCVVQLQ